MTGFFWGENRLLAALEVGVVNCMSETKSVLIRLNPRYPCIHPFSILFAKLLNSSTPQPLNQFPLQPTQKTIMNQINHIYQTTGFFIHF